MGYRETVEKIQNLPPMQRHFCAAAIGVAAGIIVATGLHPLAAGAVVGLSTGVCGAYLVRKGAHLMSKERLTNIASLVGGVIAGSFLATAMGLGVPAEPPQDVTMQSSDLIEKVAGQGTVQLAEAPVLTYRPV